MIILSFFVKVTLWHVFCCFIINLNKNRNIYLSMKGKYDTMLEYENRQIVRTIVYTQVNKSGHREWND